MSWSKFHVAQPDELHHRGVCARFWRICAALVGGTLGVVSSLFFVAANMPPDKVLAGAAVGGALGTAIGLIVSPSVIRFVEGLRHGAFPSPPARVTRLGVILGAAEGLLCGAVQGHLAGAFVGGYFGAFLGGGIADAAWRARNWKPWSVAGIILGTITEAFGCVVLGKGIKTMIRDPAFSRILLLSLAASVVLSGIATAAIAGRRLRSSSEASKE